MTAFLFDLAAIVALAAAGGWCLRRIGQPAVIGEILAGVLLGPTVIHPELAHRLFPADAVALLGGLGSLGVALFMFMVGSEIELGSGRPGGRSGPGGRGGQTRIDRRALVIAAFAMAVPALLGIGFGLARRHTVVPDHRAAFVVFMGVAMSITALPVLARIIRDTRLRPAALGSLALSVAAVCDLIGWLLLALAAVLAAGSTPWRLALVPVYLAVVFAVLPRLLSRVLRDSPLFLPVLFVAIVASAAVTEQLGLHLIFGAFVVGLAMPRAADPGAEHQRAEHQGAEHQGAERLVQAFAPIATYVLLPVYFVLAGMKVDLTGFTAGHLGLLAVVLLLGAGGKLAGGYAGARVAGLDRADSRTMAVLLNTRGLTELIVLTVGVQLGLLGPRLYAAMVVMALVTTAATGPLLRALGRTGPGPAGGPAAADLEHPQLVRSSQEET
jgi:Kef-type K+ transport system membrane component KefB